MMQPAAPPPPAVTKSGPEFKPKPPDYFIRDVHRQSLGTPIYDSSNYKTTGGNSPSDRRLSFNPASNDLHHHSLSRDKPKSISALVRRSVENSSFLTHAHNSEDYGQYSETTTSRRSDMDPGKSSQSQQQQQRYSISDEPGSQNERYSQGHGDHHHDYDRLENPNHHRQSHSHRRRSSQRERDGHGEDGHYSKHPRHSLKDHDRRHSEGDHVPHPNKKSVGLAFAKTMQQLQTYMSNMGFEGERPELHPSVAQLGPGHHEKIHDFPTKRLVCIHGERLLTALKLVCQKLEILAVLPQIMSRLAIGDEELEAVMGSECTEAILQLLYIQMAWLEHRCHRPNSRSEFMGQTLHQIKRRLQLGVRAKMTKLKFPPPQESPPPPTSPPPTIPPDSQPTTARAMTSTKYSDVDVSYTASLNSAATKSPKTTPQAETSTKSRSACKKKRKSKIIPARKSMEKSENVKQDINMFIDNEGRRTERKTNRTMQGIMHKALHNVKESAEDKIFRDIFYDTLRNYPSPPLKRKPYVEKQLEKYRRERRKKLHRPNCRKCLRDPNKCQKIYQNLDGYVTNMTEDGEIESVNPLDQFLAIGNETEFQQDFNFGASSTHQYEIEGETPDSNFSNLATQNSTSAKNPQKLTTQDRADLVSKTKSDLHFSQTISNNISYSDAEFEGEYDAERTEILRPSQLSIYERPHSAPSEFSLETSDPTKGVEIGQELPENYNRSSRDPSVVQQIPSPVRNPHLHLSRLPSESGEGSFDVQPGNRSARLIASLLKDPSKSKFLRSLVGMRQGGRDSNSSAFRSKLQTKRLALVKRAIEGPFAMYARRALRQKNVKELLFIIQLDRDARNRSQQAIDENRKNSKEHRATATRNVSLKQRQMSWRERWYGQQQEQRNDTNVGGRGWRLLKDPRSGKLALVKHYQESNGSWKTARIRLNSQNRPETTTERKQRRLAKVERRRERERRIQELQHVYGKEVPRIAYEKYDKEARTSTAGKKRCQDHHVVAEEEQCEHQPILSSEESESSSEDEGDYNVVVTDPYPYVQPGSRGLKNDLSIASRSKMATHMGETIGIPEESESHILGSIRVISANYNIGRLAAVEMPWIGPEIFGISADEYYRSQLQQAYREVLRVVCLNGSALQWLSLQIKPEVTEAVKTFFIQIQILQGLMYARLLMTPEEEVTRIHYLKQTWIREQRLLRLLTNLEGELNVLQKSREEMMVTLNESINHYIGQIDHAYLQSHQEISRTIAEYTKMELVTTKTADQALQELHGTLQKCIQVASIMRAKFSEAEDKLNKQKLKLQAELEAVISQYDSEMFTRQEVLDQLVEDEANNKNELAAIEKKLHKIEMHYNMMLEEARLLEAAERAKMRASKKKKKGSKKDKKKKGGKSKNSKKGGKKGKAGPGKKSSKNKKTGKGKKRAKKVKKPEAGNALALVETESELEDGIVTQPDENPTEVEKTPKKSKTKGKKAKGRGGNKSKAPKAKKSPAAPGTDSNPEDVGNADVTVNRKIDEKAGTKAVKKAKKKRGTEAPPPAQQNDQPNSIKRASGRTSKVVAGGAEDGVGGDIFEEPPTPPNESAENPRKSAGGGPSGQDGVEADDDDMPANKKGKKSKKANKTRVKK